MQTSSNFFNKNLLGAGEDQNKSEERDKYSQNHIVPDPLRLKQDLTPWTEVNPKYNLNTQRLIKFKQKISYQTIMEPIVQQVKEDKTQIISNLFNFHKSNKDKKMQTLNQRKMKRKQYNFDLVHNYEQSVSYLPPIKDRMQLQDYLIDNQWKKKSYKQKQKYKQKQTQKYKQASQDKHRNDNKKIQRFIKSISIQQYLNKLKEKERVISIVSTKDRNNQKNSFQTINTKQQFLSKRYDKRKSKDNFQNSISQSKQLRNSDISCKYVPIRNSQNLAARNKRSNFTPLESLQQSFQIYKRAAEKQIKQDSGDKKSVRRTINKLGPNFSLTEQNIFSSNVPLSSLFSSLDSDRKKQNAYLGEESQKMIKYTTLSHDKYSSPSIQRSLVLPKVNKNYSYKK